METHKNNPVTKEFTLPSLKEMLNNTPLGKNHHGSFSSSSTSSTINNNSQKSVSLKTTTVTGSERFSLPPVSSVNMQNEDSYQYVSPNSAYVMHSTLNSRPNHIPQNLYPPKPLPNTFNNNISTPQPLMNNTYIVYNDNMNMGYHLTRSPVNLAQHHHHQQQQQLSAGGLYEAEFHVPPVMNSIPLASKPSHFTSSHHNNNNNNQGMYTVVPQLVQNVVPMPIPQTYVQQSNIPPYHLSPQNQVYLTSVNHQPFINKNSLVPSSSSANIYQPSSSGSLQENKNNMFQKEQQYLPQHSSSMGNNSTLSAPAPLFPHPQSVSPVYRNKINPQYSVPSNNNSNNTPRQEVDRNTLHYSFNNTTVHKPVSPLHYKEKTGGKTKKVNRFPCAICSKPFNRFDALKTHMNMHLGLKPFNCKVCGKSFNAKQNMLRHERNHSNKY